MRLGHSALIGVLNILGFVCTVFCHLIQTRVTQEERLSIEKLHLSDCPVSKSVGHFLNCWLVQEGPAHCRQCHP